MTVHTMTITYADERVVYFFEVGNEKCILIGMLFIGKRRFTLVC
jgi:hypothetical protein